MTCRICGSAMPPGALFCGGCGSAAGATPESRRRRDHRADDTTALVRLRTTGVVSVPIGEAPAPAAGASDASTVFALTFDAGELRHVRGSGLIGRRPVAADDERIDLLVAIDDPERTVSRTHLEFGAVDGQLWVADRGSSNGTWVRLPRGAGVVRCEPGRRVSVPRGGRVDLAGRWFTVG
ncbi:FHA domain-containing protein [Agromyces sp. SYSU T00194]|uniref:FHA domain-containing protein n=1 Tax=Agromyces chitinivorans TaxID=3158560 RepID=UPI00339B2D22